MWKAALKWVFEIDFDTLGTLHTTAYGSLAFCKNLLFGFLLHMDSCCSRVGRTQTLLSFYINTMCSVSSLVSKELPSPLQASWLAVVTVWGKRRHRWTPGLCTRVHTYVCMLGDKHTDVYMVHNETKGKKEASIYVLKKLQSLPYSKAVVFHVGKFSMRAWIGVLLLWAFPGGSLKQVHSPHTDMWRSIQQKATFIHTSRLSICLGSWIAERGQYLGWLFYSIILKACMNSVPLYGKGSWCWESCDCFSIPWLP